MPAIVPKVRFAVKQRLLRNLRRFRQAGLCLRYLIVINLLNGGGAYPTAAALGVHNTTVYRVARRFREQGEWSLLDGREDNGTVAALSGWTAWAGEFAGAPVALAAVLVRGKVQVFEEKFGHNGTNGHAMNGKTKRRPLPRVLGHNVSSVLVWMGKDGWTFAEARAVLGLLQVGAADNSIRNQLSSGKTGRLPAPDQNQADRAGWREDLGEVDGHGVQAVHDGEDPVLRRRRGRCRQGMARRDVTRAVQPAACRTAAYGGPEDRRRAWPSSLYPTDSRHALPDEEAVIDPDGREHPQNPTMGQKEYCAPI
jgi:hypothetical protein